MNASSNVSQTVEQWATQYLTSKGLWLAEAGEVLGTVRHDTTYRDLAAILSRDIAEFPAGVHVLVGKQLDLAASAWLAAYKPKHFARACFASWGAA